MQPIKEEIENDSKTGRSSGLQGDRSKKAPSHLVILSFHPELVISNLLSFLFFPPLHNFVYPTHRFLNVFEILSRRLGDPPSLDRKDSVILS